MTVYIAPDCPADVDRMIREDAAKRGEDVMPARPFPWNRKAPQTSLEAPPDVPAAPPPYVTEPTPIGLQYVIPGCEKDKTRGPVQMDLF